MRTDGQSPFGYLVFPVGDAGCSLVLGSQAGSGLDAVDGLPISRNETRRDVSFQNDLWHKISVRVTPTRIEVRLGQNQLAAIARSGHEFAVPQWCDAYRPLGIVSWRNTLAVRSVRLRRLAFAPPRVVKAEPTRAEELLARLRPLWAKRAYDAALAEARAAVPEAKDPETRKAAEAIARATETLPRLWKLVAAGADAMKGKTLTVKGVTGKIAGVKGDSLVLAVGQGAEVSRKLASLDAAELAELARAGAANADDHLAIALFAAFDEPHDMALARKELAAARAAGGDPSDAAAVITLAGVPAFRKAIAAAKLRLDAGDLAGAKKLVAEAIKLKPAGPETARIAESSLQFLLAQAVAACKAADFARANDLADLAAALDPKHPDVEKLAFWVRANARPLLAEAFDGPRLDRWDVESGFWRIANGRLITKTAFQDTAQIFLRSASKEGLKDFTLTFDVGNSSDARAFRFGVVFREQAGRKRNDAGQFLYCLLSATHSLLCAGGATAYSRFPVGVVDGVRFRYTRPEPLRMGGQSFPVDVGKLYRMAVRCQGNAFECYINDQLVVEGVAGVADAGRIGLLVQGGECVFDNVKLYTPAPLPDLTLLGAETEVEE
ncbi:MAG: DUF1080 domain-containing protein [Planctomycetes bacterium]|nr:DUF1080 domain-containing protein [Planctomycetota bacterium]